MRLRQIHRETPSRTALRKWRHNRPSGATMVENNSIHMVIQKRVAETKRSHVTAEMPRGRIAEDVWTLAGPIFNDFQ